MISPKNNFTFNPVKPTLSGSSTVTTGFTSLPVSANGNGKRGKRHAILNPNNVLISAEGVQKVLALGGIHTPIRDLEIWRKAFIHKSYIESKQDNDDTDEDDSSGSNDETISPTRVPHGVLPLQTDCNETLEWLGDAQLQAAVTHYLFLRYPKQDEGFMTKLRSKLVKTKNLAYLSTKLGLAPYLVISYHVEFGCHGRTNQRILENTFEAFIGAMYLDFAGKRNAAFGYEVVRRFVIAVIEKYVDLVEMVIKDDNYKDQLMWLFQKSYNGAYPIYEKEKKENEYFHIYVKDPKSNDIVGRGVARSKKKAEQHAAKDALQYYAKKEGVTK